MRRKVLIVVSSCVLALSAAAIIFQVAARPAASARPLAEVTPAGAILFIEAKDFGAVLKDWNASPEKQSWLKSDNYQVFSRSKLFLRLRHDQEEFAQAAGFSPDRAMLDQGAGGESVFAIYDIGKLEFLYVTRTPQARAAESLFWKTRGEYQPRKVGNSDYYVRVEPQSQRTVAFAVSGDYLLLATREDLLAQSLSLLASASGGKSIAGEGWYTRSVATAGQPADLRMVLNLEAIAGTPQFRSYWIQENVAEIKARYSTEVADVFRSSDEYREQRVLLLKAATGGKPNAVADPEAESAVGQLLRLVPADQVFYQAWAKPTTDELMQAISTEVLSPHFGPRPVSRTAPGAAATTSSVGSESDLEVRIDEPPPPMVKAGENPLKTLLTAADPVAVMKLKSTQQTQDGVFVQPQVTIALLAKKSWDAEQAREVLEELTESMTTARLGTSWTPQETGASVYYTLDGLSSLCIFTDKNLLVVSNSPQTMQLLLNATAKPSVSGAWYVAGLAHARETGDFIKMTRSIENTGVNGGFAMNPEHGNDSRRQPKFFSDNIGSLSRTLKRVESETIEVHDLGDRETQTVRYKWSQ